MSSLSGTHVAHRLYYDEPATLAFDAEVTAIREVGRVDGRQVWQIALDRTAFYPTSGGQPFDTGTLTATARSGALLQVPVTGVDEDADGEVWHTTGKPLQEGTTVHGGIDAARRRDHMQQHTGQHLLSAVLHREFRAETISFHLGPQHATVDVTGTLDEQALRRAEHLVNRAVGQALPVSVRYASRDEADGLLAGGLLRKLPPREGRIRLVEIAGLDLNACGGTHAATTAEAGPLALRGTERVRDALRLSFLCGDRALVAAASDFQQVASLARSLSVGVEGVADSVARLQAESRVAAKERATLLQSLAAAEAAQLAAAGDPVVIHTLDPQAPGRDAAYGKLLAAALVSMPLVKSALVAAPESDRCSVVLATAAGTLDCGTLLRTMLPGFGGRGGGSHGMAQGSLPQAEVQAFLISMRATLSGTAPL